MARPSSPVYHPPGSRAGATRRETMEYVLLRYHERPDQLTAVASTANPAEAVELTRRWQQAAPEQGLIVTIGGRAFVHCTPRERA